MEHVLLIWLTLDGPMIRMTVSSCAIGEVWAESAQRWSKRTGVEGWGYLCDTKGTPVFVKVHQ